MRTDRAPTGPLHGLAVSLSPAVRISLAVLWVFILALLPHRFWLWPLASAVALVVLSLGLRISWIRLLKRVAVLCPFLALTALGFLGQPDWWPRLGGLLVKATLCLWILSLVIHVTPFNEFVAGLRRLHFPAVWVDLFAFLFRYFIVLSEEWRRMQLARRARTFRFSRRQELHLLTRSLGALFIRAYERAERVHQAMLARGYNFS